MSWLTDDAEFAQAAAALPQPVLVAGACGFIGGALLRKLLAAGVNAYGVTNSTSDPWRLAGVDPQRLILANLNQPSDVADVLARQHWGTWFHLVAHGAYPAQQDVRRIFDTNVTALACLTQQLAQIGHCKAFIHAGSSSEYGHIADRPSEDTASVPNSHYSLSKFAATAVLAYMARTTNLPSVNLRLYSVYGPYEDPSRLMPAVIREGRKKMHPPYASPNITRDFVYIDDVCLAFVQAARYAETCRGESFNIGSGVSTSLAALSEIAAAYFGIPERADFGAYPDRPWEVERWCADPGKAARVLNWRARYALSEGLAEFNNWVATQAND